MGLTDLETIPETGAVFTIGRSRFADNVASHFFIRRDPVISISCGDEHSAVICQSGRLFVFGSNDWGQLGLGHKNHISKPSCVKVLKPEKVTHVACGRAHTLICTAEKIFACGSDQEGQLGRGISAIGDSTSTPVLIYDSGPTGSKIVQIVAGSHHSLALTSDGNVFAWGSNLEGQLGLPDISGLVNKPTKVHIPEPVKRINTGYYHSIFLTENGLVYVCGESESGKLGIDINFSTQIMPKQMQLPNPVIYVACGGHHTMFLTENNNLYCTGSNSSGQLGLGTNVTELHTPKLLSQGALKNERISRISCGESHTAILTESGKLYTCGDGRHGKLGLEENENNVHELTFVQRYKQLFISNISCGGCHTILIGQRRETNRTQKEMDNSQVEHIQKRNALPPLKVPVNRLQNETRDEHSNEIINDRLNLRKSVTESVMSSQETMEIVPQKIEENIKYIENDVTNNVIHSMNDIQKSESPKNSPKNLEKKSLNDISEGKSNEEKIEIISEKSSIDLEESKKLEIENENEESKDDDKKSEMRIDIEKNVDEKYDSESMNSDENKKKKNDETNTSEFMIKKTEYDKDINNENKDITDNMQTNSEDFKSEAMKLQTESYIENDSKQKMSPEKQISSISSDFTSPTKPARLKVESENSYIVEISSSMENKDENGKIEKEKETNLENDINKKLEMVEENEPEKSEKGEKCSTKNTNSGLRVDTEKIIKIDKQNEEKDTIIEEEKLKIDNGQDDADVVQSPPPRTGKMGKIFKSKKPQAMENGSRITGTVNQKSKSKTCIIL
ncbi:X-linked retinitis pigmentosa GTPase regulator isoform X2 [Apis mellifera]|uniref:X-linked retinitis pigmentosa GTPase regulator isoform X2 n=1 Tax=Apis mellifera TaxID=7460 RepID=A0A7M7LN17_APIME|nr:X-linked retinitis pigmentosa GTPase regulator isoform X2 [Apis mellifera]|eukprot:XP_006563152.1 X-linked retinitis pigmentosa GTPase regulator isoform X2 [Apis mellifera]